MNLIDTNIFLEIILGQEMEEKCKIFLKDNSGALFISDFSVHSIGVVLFRYNMEEGFQKFLEEIYPYLNVLTLGDNGYQKLKNLKDQFGLDFDDAYQFSVAKEFGLRIITMDKDFKSVENEIEINFLA